MLTLITTLVFTLLLPPNPNPKPNPNPNQVARQLFSNALISAGLLDDPRTMLADLNQILEHAAKGK